MKDERFTNLGKEINRSVGRVLSSEEFAELKQNITSAMDQVAQEVQKATTKVEGYQEKVTVQMNKHPKKGPVPPPTASYGKDRARKERPYYDAPAANSRMQYTNAPQSRALQPYKKIRGGASAALCAAIGALGLMCMVPLAAISWIGVVGEGIGILPAMIPTAIAAGFGLLTAKGVNKNNRIRRYRWYQRIVGGRPYCTFRELSETTHLPLETVQKDVRKMVSANLLPSARIDDEKTCLILDDSTYSQYLEMKESQRKKQEEETRRQEQMKNDPQSAALHQMMADGERYLKQIRAANDALPEEEISRKLDQMEDICRKIFGYVEQHPEKLPQIRKFMCYYLPTTLKLVETFQQLESHQVASSSIEDSKAEIRSALDKINLAFQNLFEKLVQNDLMDISANISVLETMLAQEGLTDDSRFGPRPSPLE